MRNLLYTQRHKQSTDEDKETFFDKGRKMLLTSTLTLRLLSRCNQLSLLRGIRCPSTSSGFHTTMLASIILDSSLEFWSEVTNLYKVSS